MYNKVMDQWLPSFVDELEKIAISRHLSTYGPQARRGRRPIRVSRMIEKDTAFWNARKPKENEKRVGEDDQAKHYEHEGYQQHSTTPESGDDAGQRYFASGA